MSEKSSSRGPAELLHAAGVLKTIKRKGWAKAGVVNQESVADHSFRMALIGAYLGPETKLDTEKIIRMCLIHDLAESEIGDLTPDEKSSEDAHRKDEEGVMKEIFETLPDKERKIFTRDMTELFAMRTSESRIVWQIDKLEMGLTMKDYLRSGGNKQKLADFNPSAHLTKELRAILEEY